MARRGKKRPAQKYRANQHRQVQKSSSQQHVEVTDAEIFSLTLLKYTGSAIMLVGLVLFYPLLSTGQVSGREIPQGLRLVVTTAVITLVLAHLILTNMFLAEQGQDLLERYPFKNSDDIKRYRRYKALSNLQLVLAISIGAIGSVPHLYASALLSIVSSFLTRIFPYLGKTANNLIAYYLSPAFMYLVVGRLTYDLCKRAVIALAKRILTKRRRAKS